MRHPYKLEIAVPAADINATLTAICRKWRGLGANASTNGTDPATHFLGAFPVAEYMKDNWDALDKTGLQYRLCDCENGGAVLSEVEITVQRIAEDA